MRDDSRINIVERLGLCGKAIIFPLQAVSNEFRSAVVRPVQRTREDRPVASYMDLLLRAPLPQNRFLLLALGLSSLA